MTAIRDEVLQQVLGQIKQAVAEAEVADVRLIASDLQLSLAELGQALAQLSSTGAIEMDAQETAEDALLLKQVKITSVGLTQLRREPLGEAVTPFLERVRRQAGLDDLYDARDVTEVVFRTMRDLMTTEASDRVASELTAVALPTEDQALGQPVSVLWRDTNPIVALLSRLRGPLEIKPETFLFRIQQEAGLQRGIDPERAVEAVFAATKYELSEERIQEISTYLPDEIRQLWTRS